MLFSSAILGSWFVLHLILTSSPIGGYLSSNIILTKPFNATKLFSLLVALKCMGLIVPRYFSQWFGPI